MARQFAQGYRRCARDRVPPQALRLALSIVALACGFAVMAPVSGFAGCVYPDDYMVRRDDMTVDYAATMDCIKSFEEETEKRIEEANEQLEDDLEMVGQSTIRTRQGRRAYNMARLRTQDTERLIAELRATMARILEETRGIKRLAESTSSSDGRKIEIIRTEDEEIPTASENPRLQFIRPTDGPLDAKPPAPDTE